MFETRHTKPSQNCPAVKSEILWATFHNHADLDMSPKHFHWIRLITDIMMVKMRGQTESRLSRSDQQTVEFWKLTVNGCDRINTLYTKVHLKIVATAAAFCPHSLRLYGAIGGQKKSRLSRSKHRRDENAVLNGYCIFQVWSFLTNYQSQLLSLQTRSHCLISVPGSTN